MLKGIPKILSPELLKVLCEMGHSDRFDFYDEAKKVYCIIATGEAAVYANVMLQKDVV